MASITLEYDGRNTAIKKALDLILYLGARVKKTKSHPKNGLDEALEDIEAGRVYEADSVEDMMKQILG
ncbi:MAG: hypothetical protein IJP44_09150 [Bacteroidales bacterium]|nr:hypothetical protein [Bacteroidales bacterium]